MVHSFYVVKNGVSTSVDNKTSPKKTNSPHGNPAGESTSSPVGKTGGLVSGNVAAGG